MNHLLRKFALIGLAVALSACNSTATPSSSRSAAATVAINQPEPTLALPAREVQTNKIVSVDGSLALTAPSTAIGFDTTGVVKSVNATLGQSVKKGRVLATIDDVSLQDAVTDAQMSYNAVAASIAQQSKPATKADLAAAQAALSAAYAGYNTTKAGTTAIELEAARKNLEAATYQYHAAQAARDLACGSTKGTSCKNAEAAEGNAYESLNVTQDKYDALLAPVSQNTLTQAYASVAAAKAKLDALKSGLTDAQRAINAAQLSQAQAALDRAKANLTNASLVAPCDCVVQSVNIAVGMQGGNDAFTLVDLSSLRFQTTNLTERDIANIKEGAAVTIRLKAHTDPFTGTVSSALSKSTGSLSGVALYTVFITLNPTDKMLLQGMTGQAEIALGS